MTNPSTRSPIIAKMGAAAALATVVCALLIHNGYPPVNTVWTAAISIGVFFTILLNGAGYLWGWLVGALVQALNVGYGVATHQYGFTLSAIALLAFLLVYRDKRHERRPTSVLFVRVGTATMRRDWQRLGLVFNTEPILPGTGTNLRTGLDYSNDMTPPAGDTNLDTERDD